MAPLTRAADPALIRPRRGSVSAPHGGDPMADHRLVQTRRARLAAALAGDGPHGRATEGLLFALTAGAAILYAAQTMPDLGAGTRRALDLCEIALSVAFLAEYLLRLWSSPRPLAYVFSFWGLVDLAATAPALALFGVDAAGVRALRLLRLSRLIKVLRIGDASDRLRAAIASVAPELGVFFCFASVTLYLSAMGIYIFEHEAQPEAFASIPHSLWWAMVTLTTVGYGDVYPITAGGKIFTGFVLLIGLSIVAIPTALFSSALLEARSRGHAPTAPGPADQDAEVLTRK